MTFTPGARIVYQIYRTEARFGYFVRESDMLDCHGQNAGYVWIGVFACESVPHGETTIVRKDLIRKATRDDFETFRHQIPRDFKEPTSSKTCTVATALQRPGVWFFGWTEE